VSAIHVTPKAICGRLVLVPEPRKLALFVTMPYAPTSPTLSLQPFFDLPVFSLNFFPGVAPQIVCKHDPTSNLAESRYPRDMHTILSDRLDCNLTPKCVCVWLVRDVFDVFALRSSRMLAI